MWQGARSSRQRNTHWISLLTQSQIEQKIDTMYPRQDPKKLLAEKKEAPKQGESSMSASETLFLFLAVVAVLLFVGGLMVRLLRSGPVRAVHPPIRAAPLPP